MEEWERELATKEKEVCEAFKHDNVDLCKTFADSEEYPKELFASAEKIESMSKYKLLAEIGKKVAAGYNVEKQEWKLADKEATSRASTSSFFTQPSSDLLLPIPTSASGVTPPASSSPVSGDATSPSPSATLQPEAYRFSSMAGYGYIPS